MDPEAEDEHGKGPQLQPPERNHGFRALPPRSSQCVGPFAGQGCCDKPPNHLRHCLGQVLRRQRGLKRYAQDML